MHVSKKTIAQLYGRRPLPKIFFLLLNNRCPDVDSFTTA
ncbi:MAG: hypothetical protein GQF41_2134 [Candidatus Rifleibacterium amylolyticum]|nr:MAG: hypothetical protein GQF41_2134 [Candidatus Rifleibacterium amylolyticum]